MRGEHECESRLTLTSGIKCFAKDINAEKNERKHIACVTEERRRDGVSLFLCIAEDSDVSPTASQLAAIACAHCISIYIIMQHRVLGHMHEHTCSRCVNVTRGELIGHITSPGECEPTLYMPRMDISSSRDQNSVMSDNEERSRSSHSERYQTAGFKGFQGPLFTREDKTKKKTVRER